MCTNKSGGKCGNIFKSRKRSYYEKSTLKYQQKVKIVLASIFWEGWSLALFGSSDCFSASFIFSQVLKKVVTPEKAIVHYCKNMRPFQISVNVHRHPHTEEEATF